MIYVKKICIDDVQGRIQGVGDNGSQDFKGGGPNLQKEEGKTAARKCKNMSRFST